MLGIREIQEIIPHRHPFLLVDCIEELEPGVCAVGYKSVSYNAYFGGMDHVKFKKKVVPGDKLRLECRIIKQKGPVGIGSAVATVDGKTAASAELTFMIG